MKLTQRPDDVAQEAIEWMVLLRSGDATEDDFRQGSMSAGVIPTIVTTPPVQKLKQRWVRFRR